MTVLHCLPPCSHTDWFQSVPQHWLELPFRTGGICQLGQTH